jgi:C4-dicarboxylate-specific signal transduction histidine kinase
MVLALLNELEKKRFIARRADKPETHGKRGLFARFDLAEIRRALATSYPRDTRLIGLVDEKSREIQEGVTEVQNVLSRYSRLATLGSLIDRVLHDGRTVVARLKNIARFGKRDLGKSTLSAGDKIALAETSFSEIGEQSELLSALFNQIEPFGGRKRGRPKDIQTGEVVRAAVSILKQEADDRGVELTTGGEDIAVRLDQSEVLTVLINLIQNAIYWTSTQAKDAERKVSVSARRNADTSLTFVVSDSGPGVPEELRDSIFDPYFSSKPDGVGLGLSIAGNVVGDIYDGELVLVDGGPLNGATFEATFRRRV